MNNEEIKVMIKDGVYSEDGITYMSDKQYNNYINIIEQLQQENKQLKEVIDKSIDYIGSNDIEVLKYYDIPSETSSYEIVTIDLLKILKGGEND